MNHTHPSNENLAVLLHTLQTNKHLYTESYNSEIVGNVDAMVLNKHPMRGGMIGSEPVLASTMNLRSWFYILEEKLVSF